MPKAIPVFFEIDKYFVARNLVAWSERTNRRVRIDIFFIVIIGAQILIKYN